MSAWISAALRRDCRLGPLLEALVANTEVFAFERQNLDLWSTKD